MFDSPGTTHALVFASHVVAFMGISQYLARSGYLELYPWAFVAVGLLGSYHFSRKNG